MLNSLSNNPGDGKLNVGMQSQEEPVIQEVYEPEPDDYNFEPQIREVDEEELRNLSAIREETQVDTRVYKVSAAFLILALIGGVVGLMAATNSAEKSDIARKSKIAKTIQNTMKDKLDGFNKFSAKFDEMANGSFNESSFDAVVPKYSSYNFMLDISSEVTSEAILLAGDKNANPLSGVREYSAHTMLLTQLLGTHSNETHADAEEILELTSKKGDGKVMYALEVLPTAIKYLTTDAPRGSYANGVVSIFTYKDVIKEDGPLADAYAELKIEEKWPEYMRLARDYVPEGGKKRLGADALNDEDMILPNHILYEVLDRRGNKSLKFADQLLMVDRTLLFGKSANAKERYELRNKQIKEELNRAREASSNVIAELDKFIIDADRDNTEKK